MQKIFLTTLCFIACTTFNFSIAQSWVDMMKDPSKNFYEVQHEFEKYWQDKDEKKSKGYNPYKRWEEFMEPRVYPSGNRFDPSIVYREYQNQEALNKNGTNNSAQAASAWKIVGPTTAVPTNGGAGRVPCVRFHPTNSSIIYAGSPAGGLWKSTNGGTSWSTNTDALASLGITDIAINPTNANIMYLATGDGEVGCTYSVGVLKSIDGGNTWNSTGLSWATNQTNVITKLLIDPSNVNTILAATNTGIYRSTNAGVSWVNVLNVSDVEDLKFKPGNSSIVYATASGSPNFYRSSDNGVTYSIITTGLPTINITRYSIAVTPADPNYVYLLAAKWTNGGFEGLYRSTDAGLTFSLRSYSPNILGWTNDGSDAGGQGFYDLSIAVSPTNKDFVICGGINIWNSTDGGASWSILTYWLLTGTSYVHADVHDLQFLPGSGTTIFAGCDGGVYKTTDAGQNWYNLSNGLEIAQIYRIGLSASDSNLFITGWQDNHSVIRSGLNTWKAVIGGDGMDCFVDWSNNSYIYGSSQKGNLCRSSNGGTTWYNISSTISEAGGWLVPWMMDPANSQTLYAGYTNVWKTTDRGNSWSKPGTLPGTGYIIALAVAPSNTQTIYAARLGNIYKSTNGGVTWATITGSLPVASAAITGIAVSTTNKDELWVTFSGFSSANKVFTTSDGGSTWTNISTGLPNIPVNCVTYHNVTAKGIYVGTDVGVYYRDNTTAGWVSYSIGLPNVVVRDLEIFYGTGKLRAATFGRGVWETPLYVKPISTIGVEEGSTTFSKPLIFPNPANEEIGISFNALVKENYTITLVNMMGQTIYEEHLDNFSGNYSGKIDLRKYGSGMYILTIRSASAVFSEKMVHE